MKDRRKRILVVQGHGGRDKGARHPDGQTWETDICHPAGSLLAMVLRPFGYDVVLGKSGLLAMGEKWSIGDRVRWADNVGGDLLVSVHANACESHAAEGSEVLYCDPSDLDLAQRLAEAICIHRKRNRGAKQRTDLGILKVDMPAVLLELGFVDDNDGDSWDDRQWLLKHWPEQVARAAVCIHQWMGEQQ